MYWVAWGVSLTAWPTSLWVCLVSGETGQRMRGDSRDWKTRSPWGWVCVCMQSERGGVHTHLRDFHLSFSMLFSGPSLSYDARYRAAMRNRARSFKAVTFICHLNPFPPHSTIFCSKCCWYSKLIGQFRQCVSESGGFYSPSVSDNAAIGARAGDKTLKWITGDWDYRCCWSTRGDNEVCEDLRISLCTAILLWLRTKRRRAHHFGFFCFIPHQRFIITDTK